MTTLPLPDMSDPLVAPHWQAAARGEMAMQRCADCGHVRWPAARSCPECLADGGEWMVLSGRGTIWSFATYETPLHPDRIGRQRHADRCDAERRTVGRFVLDQTVCRIGLVQEIAERGLLHPVEHLLPRCIGGYHA